MSARMRMRPPDCSSARRLKSSQRTSPGVFGVLVPPIVLVTTLPISIAGWGVRESATVIGFGFIGVAPADALALSVLFGLVQIVMGVPGGIMWLAQKGRGGAALQKSTQRPPRSQSP